MRNSKTISNFSNRKSCFKQSKETTSLMRFETRHLAICLTFQVHFLVGTLTCHGVCCDIKAFFLLILFKHLSTSDFNPMIAPQSATHYQRWYDLTGSIDRDMRGIVYAKGAECFQSAKTKQKLYFCMVFPVESLITHQFECVISQMKENKFLIKFLI